MPGWTRLSVPGSGGEPMASPRQVRIGTRGSALARWQAEWVAARLAELGIAPLLVPITTQGDVQQRGPVEAIATRGVFTKEIQQELLAGRVDVAVHSLKDLPTDPVPGVVLAAVPERASVADVLVSRRGETLEQLPAAARLGTGSLRRRSQLRWVRPDLETVEIRGNLDTRLRKLAEGACDALVLAEAGLQRLGLQAQISQILPTTICLPAVGQGALGLECRQDDPATAELLRALDHPPSHAAVLAERALLAELEGGCLAPIAAWGRVEEGQLCLSGRVLDREGTRRLDATLSDSLEAALALGQRVAAALLAQGATELIASGRPA